MEIFPGAGVDAMTVVDRRTAGAAARAVTVEAEATDYGNPLTYSPEERPSMALDGDPETAWRTAGLLDARGQRIDLRLSRPVTIDHIGLLQPTTGATRYVTRARLHFYDGAAHDSVDVDLAVQSRSEPGQVVSFPRRRFDRLGIEILADSAGQVPRYAGQSSVGFAEVDLPGVRTAPEAVRLPTDLLAAAGAASRANPLAISVVRQRQDPTDPSRRDEEPGLMRLVSLPTARSFSLTGEARLSVRAEPLVKDALLGRPHDGPVPWVRTSNGIAGTVTTGAAAFDGDPGTMWSTARSEPRFSWIDVVLPRPVTIDHLPLTVVADGLHSVPTEVELSVDGRAVGRFRLPAIADGARQNATTRVDLDVPEVTGSRFRVRFTRVRERRTNDWVSDRRIAEPAALAEIGLPGARVPALRRTFDSGCRADLVTVDGRPVPVRVIGPMADALAARPLAVRACGPGGGTVDVGRGEARLTARPGVDTGIDLDALVLRSAAGGGPSAATGPLVAEAAGGNRAGPSSPRVAVVHDHGDRLALRVSGAAPGEPFWLVLGQSFNTGWQATAEGRVLATPQLVDGYANGWLVVPRHSSFDVGLAFTPQRHVERALWLSALAALGCVVLALRRPRRAAPPGAPGGTGPAPGPPAVPAALWARAVFRYRGPPAGWRAARLTGLGVGLGAAILAGPLVGVVVGLAALAAARRDAARPFLLLGSPAALGLVTAYVLYIQLRHAPEPSFDWPYEMRAVHSLGWLAALLLAADVVVSRVRDAVDQR
jgi:hypothetical protein